eukprot:659959-Rhodomonas_salina.1
MVMTTTTTTTTRMLMTKDEDDNQEEQEEQDYDGDDDDDDDDDDGDDDDDDEDDNDIDNEGPRAGDGGRLCLELAMRGLLQKASVETLASLGTKVYRTTYQPTACRSCPESAVRTICVCHVRSGTDDGCVRARCRATIAR